MVFFYPSSRARFIFEISIITIGSDTSLGRDARAGLDGVNAQLRASEDEKQNHSVARRLLNVAGVKTICTPIVMSAYGVRAITSWSLDGGYLQKRLWPSQGSRKNPHVATVSTEALVEHDVLGHALKHSVRGH